MKSEKRLPKYEILWDYEWVECHVNKFDCQRNITNSILQKSSLCFRQNNVVNNGSVSRLRRFQNFCFSGLLILIGSLEKKSSGVNKPVIQISTKNNTRNAVFVLRIKSALHNAYIQPEMHIT